MITSKKVPVSITKSVRIWDFFKGENLHICKNNGDETVTIPVTIKNYTYEIPVGRIKTNFNGFRWTFICPLCKRRCYTLYKFALSNFILRCRKCINLAYPSQLYHRNKYYELIEKHLQKIKKIDKKLENPHLRIDKKLELLKKQNLLWEILINNVPSYVGLDKLKKERRRTFSKIMRE